MAFAISGEEFSAHTASCHCPFLHSDAKASISSRLSGSGVLGSLWNITKMSVGIGMLSFPYGFQRAGFAIATITLCVVGLLSISSVYMLASSQKYARKVLATERVSYMEVVHAVLGDGWQQVAAACMFLANAGTCIAYEIFICNTFATYFPELSFTGWLLVLQCPLVVCCAFRSLRWLSVVSFIGLVCLWLGTGMSMWLMIENAAEKSWASQELVTDLEGFSLFIGLSALSFEGLAVAALTVEQSMKSPEYFMPVVIVAIVFILVLECSFALLGCFSFGSETDQVITKSFPTCYIATMASIAFSLELLFTFPGAMYPVWKYWEVRLFGPRPADLQSPPPFRLSLVLSKEDSLSSRSSRRLARRACALTLFRSVGVFAMAGVAWTCRDIFAEFVSLIGSFTCSAVVFLIPARLHLKLEESYSLSWFLAVFLLMVAIVVPIIGLTTMPNM